MNCRAIINELKHVITREGVSMTSPKTRTSTSTMWRVRKPRTWVGTNVCKQAGR